MHVSVRESRAEILNETTLNSIPANSFTTFSVDPSYNYKEIEVGLNGADTFTNQIELEHHTKSGKMDLGINVLASGSRFRGIAKAATMGSKALVVFRNLDAAAAHSVYRYIAGIK